MMRFKDKVDNKATAVALDFFSNLSINSTPILKHYERQNSH